MCVLDFCGGMLVAAGLFVVFFTARSIVRCQRHRTSQVDDAVPPAVPAPDQVPDVEPDDGKTENREQSSVLEGKQKLYFAPAGEERALQTNVLYDTVRPSCEPPLDQDGKVFRLEFFRDLHGKHLPDTNAQCARRLPTGRFLLVRAVQVEVWMGKGQRFDLDCAWVRVQLNKEAMLNVPLRSFKDGECGALQWQYTHEPDDLCFFTLDPPVIIVSEHDIEVQLFMPADAALPAAVRLSLVGRGGTTHPQTGSWRTGGLA